MNITEFSALPLQQRFRLFVEWLGEQPLDGRYYFMSTTDCAICRFAKTLHGVVNVEAGGVFLIHGASGNRSDVKLLPNKDCGGCLFRSDTYGKAFRELLNCRQDIGTFANPFAA